MSHAQIDAAGALASIVPRAQRFPKRVFARLSAPEFREPVTIMDVSSSGLRLRIPARSRLDVLQECQSLLTIAFGSEGGSVRTVELPLEYARNGDDTPYWVEYGFRVIDREMDTEGIDLLRSLPWNEM